MDETTAKKLVPSYVSDQYEKISVLVEEIQEILEELKTSLMTRNLQDNLEKTGRLIAKTVELQGVLGSLKMVKDAYPSSPPPPKDAKTSGVQPIAQPKKVRDVG